MCPDISQYALKNQYIKFLYEKITQHIFFVTFMKNAFATIFYLLKEKRTCCQKKVLVNGKILKHWIDVFSQCLSKKLFSGAELDPKTYKKPKLSSDKKCVE